MGKQTVVDDPVVDFEMFSLSTAKHDRTNTNDEYRSLPSVLRYVMFEQEMMATTVFERVGSDWIGYLRLGETRLAMPEIDIDLPLFKIYEYVEFDPDPPLES